jgi:PAS domain S-box-containing protein
LLEMPRDCAAAKAAKCAGWTIPMNYQPVHECLRELKVGPYKDLGKITFADIFKKYWGWIIAIVFLFIVLAGITIFIQKLNRNIRVSHARLQKEVEERNRAEAQVKKSESRYRTLVESSTDAILMMDKERNIAHCNQACLDLFGYKQGEIEGKSIRIIHPSDESYDVFGQTAYPVIDEHGYVRTEWEFMRKDGTIFPVESVISPLRLSDGTIEGYIAVIRDITERKQADEERIRLVTAIEQAAESVVITDRDGTILYVNSAFEFITGYGRQEAVGQNPRVKNSAKSFMQICGTPSQAAGCGVVIL